MQTFCLRAIQYGPEAFLRQLLALADTLKSRFPRQIATLPTRPIERLFASTPDSRNLRTILSRPEVECFHAALHDVRDLIAYLRRLDGSVYIGPDPRGFGTGPVLGYSCAHDNDFVSVAVHNQIRIVRGENQLTAGLRFPDQPDNVPSSPCYPVHPQSDR